MSSLTSRLRAVCCFCDPPLEFPATNIKLPVSPEIFGAQCLTAVELHAHYRLALAHNQISTFPDEFATLPRLRYLNLRSNSLKLFPVAVRINSNALHVYIGPLLRQKLTVSLTAHATTLTGDPGREPE